MSHLDTSTMVSQKRLIEVMPNSKSLVGECDRKIEEAQRHTRASTIALSVIALVTAVGGVLLIATSGLITSGALNLPMVWAAVGFGVASVSVLILLVSLVIQGKLTITRHATFKSATQTETISVKKLPEIFENAPSGLIGKGLESLSSRQFLHLLEEVQRTYQFNPPRAEQKKVLEAIMASPHLFNDVDLQFMKEILAGYLLRNMSPDSVPNALARTLINKINIDEAMAFVLARYPTPFATALNLDQYAQYIPNIASAMTEDEKEVFLTKFFQGYTNVDAYSPELTYALLFHFGSRYIDDGIAEKLIRHLGSNLGPDTAYLAQYAVPFASVFETPEDYIAYLPRIAPGMSKTQKRNFFSHFMAKHTDTDVGDYSRELSLQLLTHLDLDPNAPATATLIQNLGEPQRDAYSVYAHFPKLFGTRLVEEGWKAQHLKGVVKRTNLNQRAELLNVFSEKEQADAAGEIIKATLTREFIGSFTSTRRAEPEQMDILSAMGKWPKFIANHFQTYGGGYFTLQTNSMRNKETQVAFGKALGERFLTFDIATVETIIGLNSILPDPVSRALIIFLEKNPKAFKRLVLDQTTAFPSDLEVLKILALIEADEIEDARKNTVKTILDSIVGSFGSRDYTIYERLTKALILWVAQIKNQEWTPSGLSQLASTFKHCSYYSQIEKQFEKEGKWWIITNAKKGRGRV